jgi:hypothetical protein
MEVFSIVVSMWENNFQEETNPKNIKIQSHLCSFTTKVHENYYVYEGISPHEKRIRKKANIFVLSKVCVQRNYVCSTPTSQIQSCGHISIHKIYAIYYVLDGMKFYFSQVVFYS